MKLILSLFCFIVILKSSQAQDSLEVIQLQKSFSKGNQNGYLVKIPQAKYKDVISEWKKYIRLKTKNNVKEVDGEFHLVNIVLPEITPDTISIYSIIKSNEGYVEFLSFFEDKNSDYYSSKNESVSSNIEKLIRDFAVA